MRNVHFLPGQPRHGHGGGPKHTLKEIAEELGITVASLKSYFSNHPDHPKAALTKQQMNSPYASNYYNKKEVITWYKNLFTPKEPK